MIINLGGGAKRYFAAIGVTYPVGSVCTCTDGDKTLTASDTTGQFVFSIPEAGTWTVSCTDGTESADAEVVIGAEGQAVNVTLRYQMYLFKSGAGALIDLTIKKQSSSTIDIGTDSIVWGYAATEVNIGALRNTEPIDITNFTKLVVDATITAMRTTLNLIASTEAFDQSGTTVTNAAATLATSANSTRTKWALDISNLTGAHYVGLRGCAKAAIYDVYLEP